MEQGLRLHWSRERDRHRAQEAVVYEVHTGPSKSLRQNPAYSPDELHRYVFWVKTDHGVLDMLAYNEDAYQVWVNAIGKIAQGEPDGDKITLGEPKSARIGPQGGLKKAFQMRTASVSPALEVENEASYTCTGDSTIRWSDGSHTSESEVELKVTSYILTPLKPNANPPLRSQGQAKGDTISIDDII